MKIKIINSYKNSHEAQGFTIVVDVLRAFTTCCFVFKNGAKTIIPVPDTDTAYRMIKDNPHFISIGERKGLKLPGFNFGNSPAEIENIDLKDKLISLLNKQQDDKRIPQLFTVDILEWSLKRQ